MKNTDWTQHLSTRFTLSTLSIPLQNTPISAGPRSEPFVDFIGISKINALFYIAFFRDSSVPEKAEQQKLSTSPCPVYFYHWLLWEAIVIQCCSRKLLRLLLQQGMLRFLCKPQ